MLELHSWVTIRETYECTEDEEENMDIIIKDIKNRIQKMSWNKPVLRALNGECFIEMTLFANRKTDEVVEIFDFYRFIGKIAKGSYGIIYMLDDEDTNGNDNEFQVFILARGQLKQRKDNYLSPFIPVVEDKYE